jgi:hypothetical protein
MSATTVIVLIVPLVWLAAIWGINRFAVCQPPQQSIRAVFGLSATSPLLVILLYVIGWGVAQGNPFAGFHDPKVPAFLLLIGLPASLVAPVFAYWGSRGRTA